MFSDPGPISEPTVQMLSSCLGRPRPIPSQEASKFQNIGNNRLQEWLCVDCARVAFRLKGDGKNDQAKRDSVNQSKKEGKFYAVIMACKPRPGESPAEARDRRNKYSAQTLVALGAGPAPVTSPSTPASSIIWVVVKGGFVLTFPQPLWPRHPSG